MGELQNELCPLCGKQTRMERGFHYEKVRVRGEEVEVQGEFARCLACGEESIDAAGMERNLEAAYAVYRSRHGILSPVEIRSLRAKYGASQKAFGLVLGFGELTINSYEQGSLPIESNAKLLRLVEDPKDFRRLLDASTGKIGATQLKRIERKLAVCERESHEAAYVSDRFEGYRAERDRTVSVFTGFAEPDHEKLYRMARLILRRVGRELYKTQLLKLLFYCDFAHFKATSLSITGWRYAAIDYGPVPEDFRFLLAEGEEKGYYSSRPDEAESGDLYSPTPDSDETSDEGFSREELSTIDMVTSRLGSLSAKELTNLTHQAQAWTDTEHANLISYELARNLSGI